MNKDIQKVYDVCQSLGDERAIFGYLCSLNLTTVLALSVECNKNDKCFMTPILLKFLTSFEKDNKR